MADEDGEQEIKKALDAIQVVQSMIDVSTDRLDGLRTQCATSAELTQQEIRTLEGKLIKLFSRQLVTKSKLREEDIPQELREIPSLTQWLQVVGLSQESIRMVCSKIHSIETLQDKPERDLKVILGNAREEELRRLSRALHNLKKYTEVLLRGGSECEIALYWDSWDRHHRGSPRVRERSRHGRASVPSEEALAPPPAGGPLPPGGNGPLPLPLSRSASSISPLHHTPAPLSPHTKGKGVKFPGTPPARRKHQTGLPPPSTPTTTTHDQPSLTKSRSHDSQLSVKIDGESNNSTDHCGDGSSVLSSAMSPPPCSSPCRTPLSHNNTSHSSDDNTDDFYKGGNVNVPRSPRTPNVSRMGHNINHHFTKTFNMIAQCNYCKKQIILGAGVKCKECKHKFHRDCQDKVPASCGLPQGYVDEFIRKKFHLQEGPILVHNLSSPNCGRSPQHPGGLFTSIPPRKKPNKPPLFPGGPDSSSNTSSCNSSTPSSPALQAVGSGVPPAPPTPRTPHTVTAPPPPYITPNRQQFHFPELKKVWNVDKNTSIDGDKIVSSTCDESERTPGRMDSVDGDAMLNRNDSTKWPRQNSLSMKEWDIPYDELCVGEVVGEGRFGKVYRGSWHGDVAVKLLNMHNVDDEAALESFKLEVATFRKTRHENLVLFMGACMKPPKLAIVTSLCKGMTLYTHIHLRKDKFNMNRTTMVAQQISQGMGYLHARGIVHKDLKSKNIFLENGRVVITDFGLFSVTKLCFGNSAGDSLGIPAGWLCYLAPELVRSLRPRQAPHADDLPFSKASDVYAFGTVWYELLCGEWPFKGQPPESVIWQVGKGVKQTLANLQASRDVKDILMLCWSYRVTERPDFARLLSTLEKLPRKRLARSPSHPVHLSRSAESVF